MTVDHLPPAAELKHKIRDWIQQSGEDGEIFEFMWMLYMKKKNAPEGYLAPCFQKMPLQWIENPDDSLRVLQSQIDTLAEYGQTPEVCRLDASLIISRSIRPESDVFLNRQRVQEDSDSGWYAGNVNETLDVQNLSNLTRISMYEFTLQHPWAARYWLMPSGTYIIHKDGDFSVMIDEAVRNQ